MTRAPSATELCDSSVAATAHRRGDGRPAAARRSRAASRAATSAERLPTVPPWTNAPPAPAGSPARSAIQRSAWFSAKTAPDPSSQLPP